MGASRILSAALTISSMAAIAADCMIIEAKGMPPSKLEVGGNLGNLKANRKTVENISVRKHFWEHSYCQFFAHRLASELSLYNRSINFIFSF